MKTTLIVRSLKYGSESQLPQHQQVTTSIINQQTIQNPQSTDILLKMLFLLQIVLNILPLTSASEDTVKYCSGTASISDFDNKIHDIIDNSTNINIASMKGSKVSVSGNIS